MCTKKQLIAVCSLLLLCCYCSSCKKLVEATAPLNEVLANNAFKDSATAISVLLNIYTQFGISGGSIEGYFAPYPSLYTDELQPVNSNPTDNEFYLNSLMPNNSTIAAAWSRLYFVVYECNSSLEGLKTATLSSSFSKQLEGEAKFLRAFAYFLLVNSYGGVPLVLTTDVTTSASLRRSDEATVYTKIIADLNDAVSLLHEDYAGPEKVRANKYASLALLAKVQLYNHNWAAAEAAASEVTGSGLYTPLEPPENVFLKNSTEAILQFYETFGYTWSGVDFQPSFGNPNYAITTTLHDLFEAGDLRKRAWIGAVDVNGSRMFYPSKYKNNGNTMANDGEYTMCLRVGEQYLIRAEARAQLDKLSDAVDDINVIRERAGLTGIAMPVSKDSCLHVIMQERQRELFTEWGNRFFDLKRTGQLHTVLAQQKPNWQAKDSVYPIPQTEINNNPFLQQNPGY